MATDQDADHTQEILLAASRHDLPTLKPFLRVPGAASVQDPETGITPLHAAIGACEPDDADDQIDLAKAKATVEELLLSGAIWNDLDANNETPGCLAWRIGQTELYDMIVAAGVRAEMLMSLMGGYEQLEDEDEDEHEDEIESEAEDKDKDGDDDGSEEVPHNGNQAAEPQSTQSTTDVNSKDYLASDLTYTDSALLDSDANGVMMDWETDIMRRSVDALIPGLTPGKRILNIGFGMGIVDGMFAATNPASHHIIEAHPAVLAKIANSKDFGPEWEAKSPGNFKVHAGRWQDVVPKLLEDGEVFDAIYFDTFAEDYSALKEFFTEYVVALMDPEGRFSFFNGLGADRRVCYDVYTKVVDLDLCEAGMDVDWTEIDVDELGGEGEGEWKGVRRRYWTLDKYRLPVCTFMG